MREGTLVSDIIVVGAGPAGVIAALTSARHDLSVILIDAKPQERIGEKTCGDALSKRYPLFLKEKLGLSLPHGSEVADIITAGVLQAPSGGISIEGEAYILDRYAYGQRLLAKALDEGVILLDHHVVTRPVLQHDSVTGVMARNRQNNKSRLVKGKIVIDCSGRRHIIRRQLPEHDFPLIEKTLAPSETAITYREIIHLAEPHALHHQLLIMFHRLVPLPGYFWIFSKGTRTINVGVGWLRQDHDFNQHGSRNEGSTTSGDLGRSNGVKDVHHRLLAEWYPSDKDTIEVIDARGDVIPFRHPLYNATSNGLMVAGDAACHVNPFTAEGHGPALVAGYHAAMQAVEVLSERKMPTMKHLWGYNQRVMTHFGEKFTRDYLLARMLQRLGIEGVDYIFRRKVLTGEDFLIFKHGEATKKWSATKRLHQLAKLLPRISVIRHVIQYARHSKKVKHHFRRYPSNPGEYPAWTKQLQSILTAT